MEDEGAEGLRVAYSDQIDHGQDELDLELQLPYPRRILTMLPVILRTPARTDQETEYGEDQRIFPNL